MKAKEEFCWGIIKNINSDDFKDIKGLKGCSETQREEKINLKINETKLNLTKLFSMFKKLLLGKLAVT